jgi:hypothetical protein
VLNPATDEVDFLMSLAAQVLANQPVGSSKRSENAI